MEGKNQRAEKKEGAAKKKEAPMEATHWPARATEKLSLMKVRSQAPPQESSTPRVIESVSE